MNQVKLEKHKDLNKVGVRMLNPQHAAEFDVDYCIIDTDKKMVDVYSLSCGMPITYKAKQVKGLVDFFVDNSKQDCELNKVVREMH